MRWESQGQAKGAVPGIGGIFNTRKGKFQYKISSYIIIYHVAIMIYHCVSSSVSRHDGRVRVVAAWSGLDLSPLGLECESVNGGLHPVGMDNGTGRMHIRLRKRRTCSCDSGRVCARRSRARPFPREGCERVSRQKTSRLHTRRSPFSLRPASGNGPTGPSSSKKRTLGPSTRGYAYGPPW